MHVLLDLCALCVLVLRLCGAHTFGSFPKLVRASRLSHFGGEIYCLMMLFTALYCTQEGQTAIHHAAINNHKTILDRLLCYTGLTVDINDDLGRTPLWWAAEAGHLDSVDILLLHGANPDPDPDPGNKR